jgi:hypothetical protein
VAWSRARVLVLALGSVPALLACGTETGNPEELELGYNARTTEPGEVGLQTPADGATVDAVWLRLGPVTLLGDCARAPAERTFGGLGFADHAGPEAAFQQLRVPFRSACGLATSLEVGPDAPADPPGYAGVALSLEGTLGDGRPFSVASETPLDLYLPLADVDLADQGSWLVTFDVARWLDVDALTALPGDEVRVAADEHADELQAVLARVPEGLAVHHDADGDGQVGPDEARLDQR